MYYVTSYTEKTAEQIAEHFETISRQGISLQLQKYKLRGDPEMVERLESAKKIMTAKKNDAELLCFLNGELLYGVGVYEKGRHSAYDRATGKKSYGYSLWESLLEKSHYDETGKHTVSAKFHKFQDFVVWAKNQCGFGAEGFQLNKELLVKNNTVYGPDTCIFLPKEVCRAINLCEGRRDNLPSGVYLHKATGKYIAKFNSKHVAFCATAEEAEEACKDAKKKRLNELAEKYKGQVDNKAYLALINY